MLILWHINQGLPWWSGSEDSVLPAQGAHGFPWRLRQSRTCLQCRRPRFNPWVGKIPWRREWPPTPVFLPGEPHGQRSLSSYSPRGHKKSDMTATNIHTGSIPGQGTRSHVPQRRRSHVPQLRPTTAKKINIFLRRNHVCVQCSIFTQ